MVSVCEINHQFIFQFVLAQNNSDKISISLPSVGSRTNASNIIIPSNISRIEVVLGKDDSSTLTTSIIAVLGVLGGAVVGALATYFTTRLQVKRETRKENEFVKGTRQIVYDELRTFSIILGNIGDENSEFWHNFKLGKRDASVFESTLGKLRKEFLQLPFNVRVTLFKPDILVLVQDAYEGFDIFSERIITNAKNQKNAHNLKQSIATLEPRSVKADVDNAIKKIKENYPEIKDK
jgi:hypothetical protein